MFNLDDAFSRQDNHGNVLAAFLSIIFILTLIIANLIVVAIFCINDGEKMMKRFHLFAYALLVYHLIILGFIWLVSAKIMRR